MPGQPAPPPGVRGVGELPADLVERPAVGRGRRSRVLVDRRGVDLDDLADAAVLPHLRAQGGGRILQTSSMGGKAAGPGSGLYHAAKWGVEGFFESVAGEVALFGIEVTLVEPGAVPTGFIWTSLAVAAPMDEYRDGPVADLRRHLAGRAGADFGPDSELGKVAGAIIASTAGPAPLRLTLGTAPTRRCTAP